MKMDKINSDNFAHELSERIYGRDYYALNSWEMETINLLCDIRKEMNRQVKESKEKKMFLRLKCRELFNKKNEKNDKEPLPLLNLYMAMKLNEMFNTKEEMQKMDKNSQVDVPAALKKSADIYQSRNGNYKDCWLKTGEVLKIIFGENINLKSADDFTKFQVINMIISKVIRYVTSEMKHQDSVDDLITYAAMLASLNAAGGNKDE